MRVPQFLLSAAAASALLACDQASDVPSAPSGASGTALASGFVTSQPAQARALVPQASIKPIISVGDPMPGATDADPEQRVWAPIPDGLGAYSGAEGLVLFANHEITSAGVGKFKNARVSRLVLDPATLSVLSGSYAVSGQRSSGDPIGPLVQRLCSATFNGAAEGFGAGWFFTGEESVGSTTGGMQLAVSNDGTDVRQLPWLGRVAHENYISVPGFGNKLVLVGTDDNNGASELYMYVANSAADVLTGSGKLYAFASDQPTHSGNLVKDQAVTGRFLEIPNPAADPGVLQTAADNLGDHGAMPFVRLEDIDYSRFPDEAGPAVYFVDTGNDATNGRVAGKVNVTCNATPCDRYGSIYRMELNPSDPTTDARLTLLARSRGVAMGDWASPDNIAVSQNSLMLQEDPAYNGFNRPERIWNFKFDGSGGLEKPKAIVELNTTQLTGTPCADRGALGSTCWESSGIINASHWLGTGTWLFDVQAHTLPFTYNDGTGTPAAVASEGGQLLYLRLPGT